MAPAPNLETQVKPGHADIPDSAQQGGIEVGRPFRWPGGAAARPAGGLTDGRVGPAAAPPA